MQPGAVVLLDAGRGDAGKSIADRLGLPLVDASHLAEARTKERSAFLDDASGEGGCALTLGGEGLSLRLAGTGAVARADFCSPEVDYRRRRGGGLGERIAKAVGIKGGDAPRVIDATAGLGGDAFVLASLGCEVTLLECEPVVCLLLEDAFKRAAEIAESDSELGSILGRMHLVSGDGVNFLKTLGPAERPDVVYLDPMFPERRKSAAVKQEMQVFQELLDTREDDAALIDAALGAATRRVVVKRPRIAPPLANRQPHRSLEGKSNRFDIYQVHAV